MESSRGRRGIAWVAFGLLWVGSSGLGLAQPPAPPSVEVVVPAPPPPPPEVRFEPTAPPEQVRPREQDFYPGRIRSRHEPAFLQPFVATVPVSRTRALRVGLSGWTAPGLPFDIREAAGGVALGLTVLWDVPVTPARVPEPPAGPR